MDAIITGESKRVGLSIIDNNDVEHLIEMDESGEVLAHQQDGYPDDPSKRMPEGNEHVEQARRFAQYYVFTERGYDTVPAAINPDGLNAVRVAVAALSKAEFEQFFGDLYQQLRSHHVADVDRPLEIPPKADDPDSVLYRKQVYLGMDPFDTELREETNRLADEHGLDLSGDSFTDSSLSEMAADGLRDWAAFADDVTDHLLNTGIDLTDGLHVDATSDLHMAYLDSRGREHVTDYESPVERAADAELELPVMEAESLSDFQDYLIHNLACQIRDSFVRMGLEPPEPFQLLGYGRYEAAERYNKVDFYPNYIDPDGGHVFA